MCIDNRILTPEMNCPGAPIAPVNPDHQPRVPMAGGVPPYCSCGFIGGRGVEVDGRPLLAEHIAETGGYKPR